MTTFISIFKNCDKVWICIIDLIINCLFSK